MVGFEGVVGRLVGRYLGDFHFCFCLYLVPRSYGDL